jgi:steroid delta-isomerase-like uncharacterized protein
MGGPGTVCALRTQRKPQKEGVRHARLHTFNDAPVPAKASPDQGIARRRAMAAAETIALIESYYRAFNAGDTGGMLDCLADDVVHDVNQGSRRTGKAAFRDFTAHMERCFAEQLENVTVMATADGTRAAAEFDVLGTYIETGTGLPPASGQTYRLAAGAFFEVEGGRIARVTTYYNLAAWLKQIAAETPEPPKEQKDEPGR